MLFEFEPMTKGILDKSKSQSTESMEDQEIYVQYNGWNTEPDRMYKRSS